MKLIRPVLFVLLIPIGAFLLFLAYATADDYRPDELSEQTIEGKAGVVSDSSMINLLIWNIGYAGLDASMDFFYDGGEKMRPDHDAVLTNLEGITNTLSPYTAFDFIMLQEVDRNSKRSYHIDQYQEMKDLFQGYHASFGMNYDVGFVPIPISEPMGGVKSGLMTLSKEVPRKVVRHSFPGNYSWPMKLFMLDRCFLVSRYAVSNEKELLIINTHNSAYDDGSLRKQQMEYLGDFLLAEYEQGNYIIVGGDWNQTPYGMEAELPSHRFDTEDLIYIDKDYPAPGWNWSFDPTQPTNRRLATSYKRSSSPTTLIDCFLASPNVSLENVKTADLNFQYSDHQLVEVQARLSINH